jgi:hypothetical protein
MTSNRSTMCSNYVSVRALACVCVLSTCMHVHVCDAFTDDVAQRYQSRRLVRLCLQLLR